MDFGAAMPMRTLEPLTSITSTTTSSPTMIFSPGRRVMMSTGGFLLGVRVCWFERTERGSRGLRRRLLLEAGEEGSTDRGVRGLVDDLVALVAHDEDRRAQVGAEVLECGGGPDRHVDHRVLGARDPDALGL